MTGDVTTHDLVEVEDLLNRGYTVTAMRAGGYLCRQALPLTAQEADCLSRISAFFEEQGSMPTVREIAASMGARSLASIHRLIQRLELKGRLARIPNQKRGLVLLGDPDDPGEPDRPEDTAPENRTSPAPANAPLDSTEHTVGERGRQPLGLGWIS